MPVLSVGVDGRKSTPLKVRPDYPVPPPEIGTHRDPHRSLPPLQLTASDVWRGEREGGGRVGWCGGEREKERGREEGVLH